MKNLLIVLLFSLCLFSCAFGEGEEEAVLNLTQETFDTTINSNEFVLSMFYAPWCGHCKTLKPIFEETAQKTKGKYVLSKVDCTIEKDLCSKFEVRGYPTVVFFKNGNKKEYDGPRSVDGIISWLDKKSGPVAVELNAETIKEFSTKENNVIGFFSEKNEGYKAFIAAADDSKTAEMKFGLVSDSALFGENKEGSVVLVTKNGQTQVPAEQAGSAATLATFLFDSTFPLIQEVDASNFKNYVSRGKRLMLAWIKTKEETAKQQIEVITKVAESYPQFSFGYISHENFGPNMERMGASGKVVPAITLLSFTDNKPIAFEREGQFDEENVREFVEGVISGKYKYQLKSEALPENNDTPVTVIVGKNFDQIVHDATKDVLVEFYAPWCGHCKSLVPEYEKLGEAFKNVNDVVIGKIDLTANDVETSHYEVKGFPTILLYKRDAKTQPLQYQGARDAKSIAAWIKDNTHSETAKTVNHDEL